MDLPVPGYPISRDAVTRWFRDQHGREPTSEEVGQILLEMSKRDSGWIEGGTLLRSAPLPQRRAFGLLDHAIMT